MTSDENNTQNEVQTSSQGESQERVSLSGRTETRSVKTQTPRRRKSPETHDSTIKIGRHGADMIMTSDPERDERMLSRIGVPNRLTATTYQERIRAVQRLIALSMGMTLDESQVPARIGFDISTESQRKLLFGVLGLMTETDYKGTYQVPNEQVLGNTERGVKSVEAMKKGYKVVGTETQIGGAYENIPLTPVLKINDRSLMMASGFNPDSEFDVKNFGKAKEDLCFKQNFVMYKRYARDEKTGRVIRDNNGKTRFELVSTFSSVLNLKVISDPQTLQPLYNEISPAPVFLDEISREYGSVKEGYFLLIPSDCSREITDTYRSLFPRKDRQVPSVIHSLCWWLRLRVQDRQNKERNPLTKWNRRKNKSQTPEGIDNVLRIGFLDLCRQLNYGESSIKKNRRRNFKNLTDGIEVALKLGYLTGATYDEMTDEYTFELNLNYYPNGSETDGVEAPIPQEDPHQVDEQDPVEGTLFG